MANVRKFNLEQAAHMTKHYERGCKTYRNSDVDTTKSHMNYLIGEKRDQMKYINDALEKYPHMKRDNLIVVHDWIIDLPKELPIENSKNFFQKCYDFTIERYGKKAGFENPADICVSAYCHFDESTPHIHICCLAILKTSDGTQKFRCMDIINRDDLATFHDDLQKYMDEHKIRCKIKNGKTQRDTNGRALSVKELKRNTYERQRNRSFDRVIGGRW